MHPLRFLLPDDRRGRGVPALFPQANTMKSPGFACRFVRDGGDPKKGPREFVPPGSFFVVPSGIRPGLAGVFQLSAPFLEVSGRGEGDMGELQNQWHKCRVFVGMKT